MQHKIYQRLLADSSRAIILHTEVILNPSINSSDSAYKIPSWGEWKKLIFNHMDAWVSTMLIALVALLIHDNISWRTLLLVLTLGVGYWVAFAINDFFDAPADALDERKREQNFFVKNRTTQTQLMTAVFLICAPHLFVFAQFGWRSLIVILICMVVMWGYSAPPLRFKDRPGIDLIVHSLFVETFPYAVCLYLPAAQPTLLDGFILIIVFLTSTTAQLEQQIRDYEIDLAADTHNFTTRFGREVTVRWLKRLTLLVSILATIGVVSQLIPLWLAPIVILAMPAMAHRFGRDPYAPRSEKLINSLIILGLLYIAGAFIVYLL